MRLLTLLALVAGSLLLSACQQPALRKLHGMTNEMPQSTTRLPQPAPDLPLTDQYGRPFSLTTQQGKVVIVYFGYTSCPDVCPVTLAQLTQVWTGLGRTSEVFPSRSSSPSTRNATPRRSLLATWARSTAVGGDKGLGFTGLRGMPAELDPVMAAYDVRAEKKPQPGFGGRLHGQSYGLYLRDRHRG